MIFAYIKVTMDEDANKLVRQWNASSFPRPRPLIVAVWLSTLFSNLAEIRTNTPKRPSVILRTCSGVGVPYAFPLCCQLVPVCCSQLVMLHLLSQILCNEILNTLRRIKQQNHEAVREGIMHTQVWFVNIHHCAVLNSSNGITCKFGGKFIVWSTSPLNNELLYLFTAEIWLNL